jgi:hypothetical protein
MNRTTSTTDQRDIKQCKTCLFVDQSDAHRENCLRFARFVDHALHDASKGCDYWTPHCEQSSVNSE